MTTMIEDAVTQLKVGIDQSRAAQRRLYGLGQIVAVRFTVTINGRQVTTWRHARVSSFVKSGVTWVYQVYCIEGRFLKYAVVTQSSIRNA
jgi:hypothetical protein